MTRDEHIERHILLHRCLDELLADYLLQTDQLASDVTVMDLMQWSYQQTIDPTGDCSCSPPAEEFPQEIEP